ncbi:hypothetical protein RRG08_027585 [Elysia crispata]|uniref:Uncharacterized protein n=1 Tax=Elysia crispata TaxID=231223 RepID=A0AAE1AH45_9GAST|nr:hypothetical protein RRG08_027585 [Elysia crispata]
MRLIISEDNNSIYSGIRRVNANILLSAPSSKTIKRTLLQTRRTTAFNTTLLLLAFLVNPSNNWKCKFHQGISNTTTAHSCFQSHLIKRKPGSTQRSYSSSLALATDKTSYHGLYYTSRKQGIQ